ncbi:phosphatidylinositol/phosphatidylcholine transfer protein SFH11-like [Chenopodium quinoa]|uniref:CRAL-TRIO domain-containing protein n=1 Tax=Chenopodium quinoa TaxID=63459 RepID=A0A803M1W5_CHEQI|nr:phosphatidylinositol/phosphatidylcholine transfer protein SFH11-like [Chenopodium quinoa]
MSSSFKVLQILGKKVWRNKGDEIEDVHDPNDDQAVQQLREALLQEQDRQVIADRKPYDYHTLLRFLHTKDYDISKAKESFLNHLKWREEFGVDAIAKEFKFEEYKDVHKFYPHGYHGVDRSGRPVYIERMGMLDLEGLLQRTTLDRLVKHHVYEQEKTARLRYPACTVSAGKRIGSTTAILDVKGIGISSFSKQARYLFLEFQKIDSNYYPDTLNSLYIVNAGSGFRALWKALKTFLDAHTAAKIQVLGTNFRSKLVEAIDPSNLPSFLGGECLCSDHGGCMLSDKGPWNDPEILQLLKSNKIEEYYDDTMKVEQTWLSAQSTPDYKNKQFTKEGEDNAPLSETIKQLQITADEAEKRFRAMEAALGETKQVLQRFSEQLKGLQLKLVNTAESKTS